MVTATMTTVVGADVTAETATTTEAMAAVMTEDMTIVEVTIPDKVLLYPLSNISYE
jgi:hypothetical protein